MQKVSSHILVSGICDVLQQCWQFRVQTIGSEDTCTFKFLDGDETFYKDVKWYLEEHVFERPFEKERASQVRRQIEAYRDRLWDGLRATIVGDRLGQQPPTTLVIEVRESANIAPSSFRILWELLEDKIRDPEIRCLVTRAITPAYAECCPAPAPIVGSNVLKILLVVSRSFSPLEKDVNHQIISKPLFDIVKDKSIRDLVVIQMVRPGTFESLQEHLEAQGEGYFDMVHFDVHGRVLELPSDANDTQKNRSVTLRNRTVLCFSDLGGDSDEHDADTIGKLLKQYGVKAVILNACESAQVDANLAVSFVDAGLEFVVASSFVIHVTAATLFMKAFYEAFLLKGLDVMSAAAAGRSLLSSQKDRKARFLSSVVINDHFVPVIYQRAGLKLSEVKFASPVNLDSSPIDGTEIQNDASLRCMGRQLDILFLEALLLKDSPVVELRGFSGVGKTTLLRYLCQWWTDTDFVKKSFFLDLAGSSNTNSLLQVCRSILEYLGENMPILDEELVSFTAKKLSISGPRKCILLCFDNTEHAEARVANAMKELLAQLDVDSQAVGLVTGPLGADTQEFVPYQLDGLTLKVASEYAWEFAGKTDILAESRRQPENFEASLLLLNGIPLAIQSVICGMQLSGPTSFEIICKTLLAGTTPLGESLLPLTRNFLNLMELLDNADAFEKSILTLLSLFASRWPRSLRLMLSCAICINDEMAAFIDMDVLNKTSEITELAVGASLSFETPAKVYDSKILDKAFFQKGEDLYQALLGRLQTWSMVVVEDEVILVHPLLTQHLRSILYDKLGPESTLKILEIYMIYHHELFQRQMTSVMHREFDGNNSLAFLCDDRHNFIATQLRPLYTLPLSENSRVDYFLANISMDILSTLNHERIYGQFGPDRVILDHLWHEVLVRYEESKVRRAHLPEPLLKLAQGAALQVSLADCFHKARWSRWNELPIPLNRTWDILQDMLHTHSEEWTVDSYLGLIKLHMLVGRQCGARGDLERAISSHQNAERNIERLMQKLSTQDCSKSPQLNLLCEVANVRAINRGLLLNVKKAQKDDDECRALHEQVAKDWKAAEDLAMGLGKYAASEMKRKGDWILRTKNTAMDSDDFFKFVQDDALTETKDLVSQWQQARLIQTHSVSDNYQALSNVLLDELEQARKQRPLDWLTVAEKHEQLSMIARNRGEKLDALFHLEEAIQSFQNVDESQVTHYWDHLAYMLFAHAASAIQAGMMDSAYSKSCACLEICRERKSGRWGLRVMEISILQLLISIHPSITSSQEPWELYLWLLEAEYKEEMVIKRLISQGDFKLTDLPSLNGRDLGFQDYNLRITDVDPRKVSDLENLTFEQFEGYVGRGFHKLMATYGLHVELRDRIKQRLASAIGIGEMLGEMQVTIFMGTIFTLLQLVPETDIMAVCAEAETVAFGGRILLSKRQPRLKYFRGTEESLVGLRDGRIGSDTSFWRFIWNTPTFQTLLKNVIVKKRQSLTQLYGRRRAAKIIATKPMDAQTVGLILAAPDDVEQLSPSEEVEGIVSRMKSMFRFS